MDSDGIAVPPIGQLRHEMIDLSLPIVDEEGREWQIYAIGSEHGGVFCANGSGVKSIKLPSTLRELRAHAVSGCLQLREMSLPDSLEKIGDSAFYSCVRLGSIVIP